MKSNCETVIDCYVRDKEQRALLPVVSMLARPAGAIYSDMYKFLLDNRDVFPVISVAQLVNCVELFYRVEVRYNGGKAYIYRGRVK